MNQIIVGDCRETMRRLIAEGVKVQTCVTSPPYWGLRDYGCKGQLGLEPTIQEYVANMVDVFGLVRELLADDGTLWLNLGDSYAANRGYQAPDGKVGDVGNSKGSKVPDGMKPKDLVGIPWRVAFALQEAGWWLRQDIIWAKPNPMPESVTDRCTKAHEYLFLMTKSERYFYDAAAISEPVTQDERRPTFRGGAYCNNTTFDNANGGKSTVTGNVRVKVPSGWETGPGTHGSYHRDGREPSQDIKRSGNKERKPASARGVPIDTNGKSAGAVAGSIPWEGSTRNKRSVWTVATQGYKEAHFATFPEALIRPCILAGSRSGGIVFDPFMGSGTTARVALELGRQYLGCELNPEYANLAEQRTKVTPGFDFSQTHA